MTVITGSAMRAYELAAILRGRGIPVVLGGPHVTLIPDDAAPHADCVVTGYAEKTWPQLLRDFAAGAMRPRYDQGADFDLAESPLPRREVLPNRSSPTEHVFEATRGCVHDCEFCVVPSAWGGNHGRSLSRRWPRTSARLRSKRAIFVDLNLIANKPYAVSLFAALVPLKAAVVRTRHHVALR